MRVLRELLRVPVRGERDLYDGVRSIDWDPFVTAQQSLSVRATGRAPGLENTQFVGQRTKDAICDALRDRHGARPSVDPPGECPSLSRGPGAGAGRTCC